MKKKCTCEISKNDVIQNIKNNIYEKKDWMSINNIYLGCVDKEQFSILYKREIKIDQDFLKMIDFSPTILMGEVKEDVNEVFIEYTYTKKTGAILLAIIAAMFAAILALILLLELIVGTKGEMLESIIYLLMFAYLFFVSYSFMTVKKSEIEKLNQFLDSIRY